MKKLFKHSGKRNIHDFRRELARAHMIIALLSFAIIVLLTVGAIQPVSYDPMLSAICVVLLSIVTIISLCMSISLFKSKK